MGADERGQGREGGVRARSSGVFSREEGSITCVGHAVDTGGDKGWSNR